MPYLSALEVSSRRGAIQIHVYLNLTWLILTLRCCHHDNVEMCQAAAEPQTKSTDSGRKSACRLLLSTPTITSFSIIQPENWYSLQGRALQHTRGVREWLSCSHSFPLTSNHSHSHSHSFPFQHCIPIPIFPITSIPIPTHSHSRQRLYIDYPKAEKYVYCVVNSKQNMKLQQKHC